MNRFPKKERYLIYLQRGRGLLSSNASDCGVGDGRKGDRSTSNDYRRNPSLHELSW